jgi:hypothetical protein
MLDLYEEGIISKQRFANRMVMHEKNKKEVQDDIEKYKQILIVKNETETPAKICINLTGVLFFDEKY